MIRFEYIFFLNSDESQKQLFFFYRCVLLTAQPLQTGFIEYDSGHKTEHKAFKMSSVFNICSSKINRESIFLQNNNFYFGYFMNTIFQKSSFMCTEVGLLFSFIKEQFEKSTTNNNN